jgi:hypothetical protein
MAYLEEPAEERLYEVALFGVCIKLHGATGSPMRLVIMPFSWRRTAIAQRRGSRMRAPQSASTAGQGDTVVRSDRLKSCPAGVPGQLSPQAIRFFGKPAPRVEAHL